MPRVIAMLSQSISQTIIITQEASENSGVLSSFDPKTVRLHLEKYSHTRNTSHTFSMA